MSFRDLREFIAELEKQGEAQRIEEEVDWNLEVGAMLRRAAEAGLPAPFFQKIKGYPEGYRIFGGGAAKYSRMAIAMGMAPDTHPREVVEEFTRRMKHPIKPVLVTDGPCKENILVGDEVDLLKFPVPMIHEGDGGRYIGTWHATITKDLDSDWVNWGTYRHMVHNKTSVGVLFASAIKHMWMMYTKGYKPKNKPMEVAIAIGIEPISQFCCAIPAPYGVSEVDLAGGIRGEPVELIKCETIDLEVPATAEIVLEGEMRPDDMMNEGPYGEFSGYRTGFKELRPVIRIKAITHRNNPILTVSCGGVPVHDDAIISLTKASALLEALRARGIPVTGVSVFPETAGMVAAVAVKTTYSHIAEDIAHVIWGTPTGHSIPYIIVLDDDVDPFNLSQVFHAFATKCHPRKGIVKLEHSPVINILPFLTPEERKYRSGAKAYFDCTWPKDRDPTDIPQRVTFAEVYPLEVQERALAIWRKYSY